MPLIEQSRDISPINRSISRLGVAVKSGLLESVMNWWICIIAIFWNSFKILYLIYMDFIIISLIVQTFSWIGMPLIIEFDFKRFVAKFTMVHSSLCFFMLFQMSFIVSWRIWTMKFFLTYLTIFDGSDWTNQGQIT